MEPVFKMLSTRATQGELRLAICPLSAVIIFAR